MVFLSLSLRHHFAGNQVVASRNVGTFLSLVNPNCSSHIFFVETNLSGCQLNTVFIAKKLVQLINTRTYTQTHTPTVVHGGWGGWMESLPGVFDMLQYLETILSRVEILKMRYILRVVALLEACDVTRNGRHLGCHLGFHQELEIRFKPREMAIFCALHEK